MKFSECFISLITIYIIPKTYSADSKVPGFAGCSYFGTTPKMCGEIIHASSLPPECEALYFFWIHIDKTLEIIDYTQSGSNKAFIVDLDSVGKPMYLYYGRSKIDDWILYLGSKDVGTQIKTELKNLNTYLGQYKNIGGLVLNNLTPDSSSKCPTDLTANFKCYVDEMKKAFPKYGIGMEIIGFKLIDNSENAAACLDFQVLDPSLDFYILDLFYFNDCTAEYQKGGSCPISGQKGRTVEKLASVANKLGISKSKILFGFRSGTTAIVSDDMCDTTNTKLCVSKNLDGLCADNTTSYFEKGTFAKNNGAGFVMSNVDVADDPNGLCKCETSYPAFHDVLAGFKSLPTPKPCPLLDKC